MWAFLRPSARLLPSVRRSSPHLHTNPISAASNLDSSLLLSLRDEVILSPVSKPTEYSHPTDTHQYKHPSQEKGGSNQASMGRKLDALLRRNFKTSKFKTILGLAISRLAVLKNQHQVRSSYDRTDTAKLLQQAYTDRALLRVEHVIRENNLLDVFVMIEGYCKLLIERTPLIESQRDCPHELHEAISSIIFASSRSGELPELLEVREMFASRYGREFVSAAVDLRSNCRVNPTMIQKMSTRQPPLEIRQRALIQIAAEIGIALNLEEETPPNIREEGVMNFIHQPNPVKTAGAGGTSENSAKLGGGGLDEDEHMSESVKTRKRYADVASAAQAAFESAAFAAEAARAAVELSRTESGDQGSSDGGSPVPRSRNRHERSQEEVSFGSKSLLGNNPSGVAKADEANQFGSAHQSFDKIHPVENSDSESEDDGSPPTGGVQVLKQEISKGNLKGEKRTPVVFDESDEDDYTYQQQSPIQSKADSFSQSNEMVDNMGFALGKDICGKAHQADQHARASSVYSDSGDELGERRINLEKKPFSVRTRRGLHAPTKHN
ncbi:hypothetical protein ACLOJK_034545 [Asimina triloba]